jgi:hypothetical protein
MKTLLILSSVLFAVWVGPKSTVDQNKAMREYIENHCRVAVQGGGTLAERIIRPDGTVTTGMIRCDQ